MNVKCCVVSLQSDEINVMKSQEIPHLPDNVTSKRKRRMVAPAETLGTT